MVWAEIVLIVIGVIMIGASFYITEKLSEQDLDQISMMSEADLKRISEKQVKAMKDKVENALEDIIDESIVELLVLIVDDELDSSTIVLEESTIEVENSIEELVVELLELPSTVLVEITVLLTTDG